MSNLANGRINLKFKNSVLKQKVIYIVCELNKWPHNPTSDFTLKIVYLVQSNL